MNQSSAIVVPGLVVMGLFLWAGSGVIHPDPEEQLHRLPGLPVALESPINPVSMHCHDGDFDAVAYCTGDYQPAASFEVPRQLSLAPSQLEQRKALCGCTARVPGHGNNGWQLVPTKTAYGPALMVYELRKGKVERVDAALPKASYPSIRRDIESRYGTPLTARSDATAHWSRNYSTIELSPGPNNVRLSLIGGDDHFKVSQKTKPLWMKIMAWLE